VELQAGSLLAMPEGEHRAVGWKPGSDRGRTVRKWISLGSRSRQDAVRPDSISFPTEKDRRGHIVKAVEKQHQQKLWDTRREHWKISFAYWKLME